MCQTVHNPALGINSGRNDIETDRFPSLVVTSNGEGDHVGQLNKPSRFGIHEQRYVAKVIKFSPPMSNCSEVNR